MAAQAGALTQARSLGGRIVFQYGTLINGFSAQLSPSAAAELAKRPDVASVQPVSIILLDNASSVPFIGATKVWQQFGAKGQGMTLALVDTGIDYTHKDFGGPGTVAAYNSNNPNFVEPGTFPTDKVIGGYDFVGSNYDVLDADTSNDIPRPDFDPLDRDGHGTHTGGTCCGIGVPGSVGPGVAPKVKILAYKVWDKGNSTDDVLVAAYERAVDPNQDGDTSDHADVLSFSGGVDYGTLNSVEAVAAQRVVDLGTVFVAAAGNAGNQPSGGSAYILGTPAAARGVISVAASIDEVLDNRVKVNSPSGFTFPDDGVATLQSWSPAIPSDITNGVIDARQFDPPADTGGAPTPTDRELCDATADSFGGKIALIYKASAGAGDCTADEKVLRAQQMGASAVILWNGFGGFPFDLSPGDFVDQLTIPVVMLSEADSLALADALSPSPPAYNTAAVNATISADATPVPAFTDSMADFSSEGPARLTSDLKPDITAPGVNITSAGVGTGTGSLTISGTSMATPHVAGVAILLRQLHPTWSPARIKALLMNQAVRKMKNNDLSTPVPATVMGSGRVDAYASATAVSLAWPGSLSYGFKPAAVTQSVVRSFQVHNYDTAAHTLQPLGNRALRRFRPVGRDDHAVPQRVELRRDPELRPGARSDPDRLGSPAARPERHFRGRAALRLVRLQPRSRRLGRDQAERPAQRHPAGGVARRADCHGSQRPVRVVPRSDHGPQDPDADRAVGCGNVVGRPVHPRHHRSGRQHGRGGHHGRRCALLHGQHHRRHPAGRADGHRRAGRTELEGLRLQRRRADRARRVRGAGRGCPQHGRDPRDRHQDRRSRRRRLRRPRPPGRLPGRQARRRQQRLRLRPLAGESVR